MHGKTKNMCPDSLVKKQVPKALLSWLTAHNHLALCYSGGIDSRFLAYCMQIAQCDVLLLHIKTPYIPQSDTYYAQKWAQKHNLPYTEISMPTELFPITPEFSTKERCYNCKKRFLTAIKSSLEKNGTTRILCDGSNYDDLSVFRPGKKALREESVASPLEYAKLTKRAIREYATRLGLENPNQPSKPCLLTRFAYGIPIHETLFPRIAQAEESIAALFPKGTQIRIRILPTYLLQISKDPSPYSAALYSILEKEQLLPCAIDLRDCVSGFFDATKDQSISQYLETLPKIVQKES